MSLRDLRILASLCTLGFLIVFFVPIFYNSMLFACRNPRVLCLSNPSGLESPGYLLLNWGATYSLGSNWSGPTGGYSAPVVDSLTDIGVLLAYAFPLVVSSTALLAPEIVRISKIARISFVAFGVFAFVLSIGFLFSSFDPLIITAIALEPIATLMVVYGTRILNFRAPESS